MAFLGAFIGVDQHADPGIRDLVGAGRDARALWALFSDTIQGIRAELLVDQHASVAAIRQAIANTLGAAGPDDTVIFAFAGHGTKDHRLVAHDTLRSALADSSLPMHELAAAFKTSRARAILCILDCCFSGGAPARVLEDSPVARDESNPLETLAGTGRILIAASNINERAYEHPTARHGLLTKALMDVLRGSETTLSSGAAMDRVFDLVRAEAGRMGVTQTPVLLGHIEGGLHLPALHPGPLFAAAFPEASGLRIQRDIASLAAFRLPTAVLTQWQDRLRSGLNDLQLEAVNDGRILDGASLLVVAPTSSGKTFIGEMAAVRAIVDQRKAIFLFPYRALVNEKFDQFRELYGERVGMRIIRCTGDYLDDTGALLRGKYDLALLTYEMFLNLGVSNPALLHAIGLVVLDEAQFITDPNRGISVELLLTYLLAARERGIEPQLIALSAVIGDINNFDAWLGCKQLVHLNRPVPLEEGVLDRTGALHFLDPSGHVQSVQFLPPGTIRLRGDKPSAQDVLVPLVRQLVQQGEKVIIFRNQRGTAQGCARYLAKELGLPPAADPLAALPQHDPSSTSALLRECLQGGTAFHNTNLTREERAVVERAFREPEGKVHVLVATTTVAAGINTPADTVILAEQEFIGEEGRPFTVAEYKNMAGRAGRLGYKDKGRAIIVAESNHEARQLFDRYVQGQLEPLRSSFDATDLETWLVRLLAQVPRIPRAEVVRLLLNTFGGYLANRDHPGWRGIMAERLNDLLAHMIQLGLVEEEGNEVQLTLLGRACGRSGLAFPSAMRLVEMLRSLPAGTLTGEQLMALLQVLPESDGGYTPLMKKGRKEAQWPREVSQRYGPEVVRALQRLARDELEYFARCKRAALLWDWITGTPIETIEKRFSANPYQGVIGHGDVRRFADLTRFHLRSAHQIACVMFPASGPDEGAIERLLKQLETGIPAAGLDLLSLSMSLSRGEYLTLIKAGITSPAALYALSRVDVERILGAGRAKELRA